MHPTMKRLNRQFLKIGGYEIVDTEASTEAEVLEKARSHLRWFESWSAEAYDLMSRALQAEERAHECRTGDDAGGVAE